MAEIRGMERSCIGGIGVAGAVWVASSGPVLEVQVVLKTWRWMTSWYFSETT